MSEVIPVELAEALRSYFTVAGGHLAHPLKGGAEAVKPGANFLDNPGGKACFDLSLTQSWPSLRWDCSELGITVQVIHNNYMYIHDFIVLYIYTQSARKSYIGFSLPF